MHVRKSATADLWWTNVCTNFSPKKWRKWGTRPRCGKSGGRHLFPASPPHYTPEIHSEHSHCLLNVGGHGHHSCASS